MFPSGLSSEPGEYKMASLSETGMRKEYENE